MRRKILWGAAIVSLVTLAVGVSAAIAIRNEVQRSAQEELFRQAGETALFIDAELPDVSLTEGDNLRGAMLSIGRVLQQARVTGGHDIVEAALIIGNRHISLVEDPKLLTEIAADVTDGGAVQVDVDGTAMNAVIRRIPLARGSEMVVAIARTEQLLPVRFVSRSLLLALGAGAVLLIGFGVWFSAVTARRLAGLEAASRSFAGGDFAARAPVQGDDEITSVSVAFNEMASQLEAARWRERDFLMSVGHDLRTPLTTIRGYAEALDSGDIAAEDLDRVGGVLHTQTDRLSRLVEDLMLLARLEAREFTLRPEPVDLAAHVKEIVESYRATADAAYVRITFDPSPTVGLVVVDPDRTGQVCTNLLDNAMRYTPEGGTVSIGIDRNSAGVRLWVKDTGPGIDAEDLSHVFERLYVAQRYRPIRPEGSGLGLSIVKELVDTMGGTISVESELGLGTLVTVELEQA